jgi:hypothetical protein
MRKFLFFLSFVTVLTNAHARSSSQNREEVADIIAVTQSEIIASGSISESGDSIHGVVRDSLGPMMMALIRERNSKNEVVAQAVTDIEGHFSFKLVNPEDFLEVKFFGYYLVKSQISGSHYDIFLVRDPKIKALEESGKAVNAIDRIAGLNGYPVLILDDHVVTSDITTWKDIDPKKEKYTKEELSLLFGIKADKIKKIQYYRDSEAYKFMGERGKSGIIIIKTQEK